VPVVWVRLGRPAGASSAGLGRGRLSLLADRIRIVPAAHPDYRAVCELTVAVHQHCHPTVAPQTQPASADAATA